MSGQENNRCGTLVVLSQILILRGTDKEIELAGFEGKGRFVETLAGDVVWGANDEGSSQT